MSAENESTGKHRENVPDRIVLDYQSSSMSLYTGVYEPPRGKTNNVVSEQV